VGAALVALLAAVAGPVFGQRAPQGGTGVVRGVVTSEEGTPIPYAVVSLLPGFGQRFTDAAGAFAFTGVPAGSYRALARQVGFRPRDTTVAVQPGATRVLRFALEHLTVELEAIRVVASRGCTVPGAPDSLVSPQLARIFDQLRLNAERYRLLVDSYPFRFRMVRRFVNYSDAGSVVDSSQDTVTYRSNAGVGYRPGQVVGWGRGRGNTLSPVLNLPTLADFADSAFQASHCFAYGGLVADSGGLVVRYNFEPAEFIRTPDIAGYVDLDPQTFQVREAVVRLTRPVRALEGLASASSTITYTELFPNIVVQSRVQSEHVPWLGLNVRGRIARYVQDQHIINVTFLTPLPGRPLPEP
jgi:hypothetical protein